MCVVAALRASRRMVTRPADSRRVARVFDMMDIRTAFATKAEVDSSLGLLRQHAAGASVSETELRRARKLRVRVRVAHGTLALTFAPAPRAGLHSAPRHWAGGRARGGGSAGGPACSRARLRTPVQPIVLPLRLSFVVPANMTLDLLMLSARTLRGTVAAQWANQTYNALHYYANRNATNTDTTAQRAAAYVAATGSSVGTALWLQRMADRAPAASAWAPVLRRLAPFAAVAAADLLNLSIMRKNEFLEGVHVYDEGGEVVGRSKRAGMLAVSACILGRIGAAAPVLVIPPLLMMRLERQAWLQRRPWLRMPLLLGLVGCAIQVAVPLVFGVFRQSAWVRSTWLEPEFHTLRGADGQPALLRYNKGL